ncbi:MAG: choice-of-anchor L domain-containing protein, partial [Flavobacterium sp.]
MKKLLLFLAFMTLNLVQGQLIVNNVSQTPAQLVQNVLLGGGITATNIKFNGTTANANVIRDQVGRFANGNTTNIGLTSGIIMSTGKASVAIGPNSAGGSSQPPAFPTEGDADLAMLTTGNVRNTAILEFDFVPTGQSLSFDFVFASEEYLEFVNSPYNDVFGFFISGPGITGPYSGGIAKNIALVPSTTTAISIDNVNNASNPLYYVNNGTGATPGVNTTIQYDGFTKVIAAISNVQCGLTYHIKLAIANIGDNGWDSAVFLKANSFVVTPPFSFPADLLVSNGFAPCFGTSKQICTGLSSTILHEWTLNGVPIAGVTGPCVTITQPGQLCVTVYPYGSACPFTDCMTVEFLPPMPISNALAVKACVGSTFNLSSNTPIILNGSSASDYEIAFYHSQLDAQNTSSPITNITTYPGVEGEVIWVGITDNVSGSGCIETKSFVLNFVSDVAPVITCGTSTNTSVQFNWAALTDATNYTVSYQVNSNTPINIGAIGNVTTYTVSSLLPGNNVHITLTPVGGVGTCFVPASFTCTSASCPSITLPSASQSVCVNGDPSSFSVTTSSTSSNGINFVYFTTPQVGDVMYTGGIPLGTATPNAGGIATYDASALGTTGSLPNTAGIYYVYAIANPIPVDVACRPYEMIQVTVNAPPIAPTVVTPVTYCKDAVASALTATGTGLLWYSSSTGGVGSTTATIPNTSVVGTTTYYVSQTVSGCESPRAALEVIINPVPIVTVNSSTICQGQLATVTATVSSLGTYSYSWTVPSGVPNPGNVSSFTTSVAGTYSVIVNNVSSLCNLDFEAPCGLTPANLIFVDQSNFSCWKTTATDGLIEAWSSGFQGVSSFSGTQFVELNANEVSTLFQDISVLPGSTVNISFAHRGRLGTDIMAVEVGPIGGPYTSLGQFSAPATNWVYNSVPFTFPNNGVSNYSFRFVSVSSASGDLSSGNFLDNISITALNCPSVSTSGTVTVNATPPAPTVAPVTYCQNATATALTATGTSLLWYTAATGGVGSATAPIPVTTASGTTTYYVSQTVLGCEGPRASIVVTINATPLAPTVTTPVTYCQDATATALTATGTALLWYAAATGGVGSSTATIPSTTTAGNTTYYVSQTVSGCESPRESIVVTINATPLAPTVTTPVTYCQDATATALTATGTSLLWYTTATGGVGSATAPTPITTVAGTTTYYVSQTLLGCEGPRASIAVTVNATPLAPTVAPVTYCQNATATALTATGTSLLWYTAATGGVGSATAPIPVTTASGTTTYYVSQTVLGCEGPRASIVVTINATPLAPTVTTPVTYCQDATASALSATGTALLWYAAATGGVGSSTATIPSTTTAGNTTYYVSQTVSGCESPRESIVVTINATPLAPTVTTPVTYCQDATATALTATGTSLLWYTTAMGGVGSA